MLMEEYLVNIGHPLQYKYVEDKSEHFIALRNGLQAEKDASRDDEEITSFIALSFNLLQDNKTTMDNMRQINRIYKSGRASKANVVKGVFDSGITQVSEGNAAPAERLYLEAVDIFEAEQDSDEPLRLITRARNALNQLRIGDPRLKRRDVHDGLERVWDKVSKLRSGE